MPQHENMMQKKQLPNNLKKEKKEIKFFIVSLFGHAVLIGSLGVLGFLPSCEEKEEEVHVL